MKFWFSGVWVMLILNSSFLQAAGFSAAVSPPRYEINGSAGQVTRQVLEIFNMSNADEQYSVRTSDWSLKGSNLTFSDALLPGSCRPWVRLERRKITVRKTGKRKMRFEVHVPEGVTQRECRFALMIEGVSPAANKVGNNLNLPVNGRLAVIVYLAIGGAEPQLQIKTIKLQSGKSFVQVSNKGNAHGRLQGTLAGVDGSGKALDFSVSSMPIMPGETRLLELTPHLNGKRHQTPVRAPLSLKGDLYWSKGAFAIDKKL
ncbi:MAG: hypothetical protein ACPGSM_04280 [Thiolinea sp.]